MFVFIVALFWLGLVLIDQDSDLITQRTRESIESSVSNVSAALISSRAEDQQRLSQLLIDWHEIGKISNIVSGEEVFSGIATLAVDETGMEIRPSTAIRYVPTEVEIISLDPRLLEADQLEFRQNDLSQASTLLQRLLNDPNPDTRAGALSRLARIRNKEGRDADALEYYLQLSRPAGASVSGIPAVLLGKFGRCSILETQESYELLGEEAIQLGELLVRGGHQVSKSTYNFYTQSVVDWIRISEQSSAPAWIDELEKPHVMSEAAIVFYDIWTNWVNGRESSEGIRSIRIDSTTVVFNWVGSEGTLIGTIESNPLRENGWFSSLETGFQVPGTGLSIMDDTGNEIVSMGTQSGNIQSSRTIASAGQTWALTAFVTDDFDIDPQNRSRRGLLLGGLFLVLAIVASSTYFLSRALRRELAVSQLQSDFVSAVSHEFRTPLTSMRQLTEMLTSGRVTSEERKQEYYSVLDKESQRLSRLVEGLLNFGRMEAGGYPYVFESVGIGDVVSETIAAFGEEAEMGEEILRADIQTNPSGEIDRDMIQLALWNLLDNARKYSGDAPQIDVELSVSDSVVGISVSDNGPGISSSDQKIVFDKFVRGPDSAHAGVKGTGLGLALVQRIAREHGGDILVESALTEGSMFTLILPISKKS